MTSAWQAHAPLVVVDGKPVFFSRFHGDRDEVVYEYHLRHGAVRVGIASNDKYIQATFQCGQRHFTVVNADDKHAPLVFDGFAVDDDDFCTEPFVIKPLNTLRENHGLNVREMARAMERSTELIVHLNEAIVDKTAAWYHRLWFADYAVAVDDDNDDVVDWEEDLFRRIQDNGGEGDNVGGGGGGAIANRNNNWAPVQCKTGKHVLTIRLIFIRKNN